ncbi:unnamed protein product [Oikopleura dioica]|uniref:Tudor domain-containing protein n=1 Tax=Oikopleura dioica TaxID=34765 RepID=E4X2N8_OIKDI|nr:unnamed protein product [Oikopleura dioica]
MDDLSNLVDEIIETHDSVSLTNFYEMTNHFMANRINQKKHPGILRDKSTGELFMKLSPKLLRAFLVLEKFDWVDWQFSGQGNENFEESSIHPDSSVHPEIYPVRRSLSPTSRKSPNTSDAASSCTSYISSGGAPRNQTVFARTTVVEKKSSRISDYAEEPEDYHSEDDEFDQDNNDEYLETIALRMKVKQWLFKYARIYKKSKDAGIRMTELDKFAHEEFGTKDFDELSTEMGYQHGEDAMLHIGHPQLKLAKHKTTGKGVTKTGEWVIMEEEKYVGKDENTNELSKETILSRVGRVDGRLDICWTETTLYRAENRSDKLVEQRQTRRGKVVAQVAADKFYIHLDEDLPLYQQLKDDLTDFYGREGSNNPSDNGHLYKMEPGALRMGLPIVVWNHQYQEWARAHCVTPTANGKDLTIHYTDYGDSDNVKVKDACFLDSRFTQYPAFARGCKLFGVKPMLNNRSKYQEDLKKHCWEFFHCKHNDRMKRATFDDDRNTGNYEPIPIDFNFYQMDAEDTIVFVIPHHTVLKSKTDSRNGLTVQEHLQEKKIVKCNDVNLQLAIQGNKNDSVSQSVNPSRPPQMKSKTIKKSKARTLTAPKNNPTSNLRNEGELISSRNGLDQFAPATSAKEKTGADPLAQTTIPLESVKHARHVLKLTEESAPKKGTGLNWWNKERADRPRTAGPAEQLTRGTLQPPSQHAPAHRQHLRGGQEESLVTPNIF